MTAVTSEATPAHVLDVSGAWTRPSVLLRSMWRSRDLVLTLARKDFFVRYRRASFGVLWAVGLPLVQAAVLSVVFSHFRVVRASSDVPIPVFVFTGMAAWTYYSSTVIGSSTAIVDGAGLSSKIYFPRAVLPLVGVGANFYAHVISVLIAIALALGYGVNLDAHVLLFLPGMALLVWLTATLCLTLAALHVYFRDVRYIVQAVFTAMLYLTPIFIPMSIYRGLLRWIVLANPATGVVEVFRLAIGAADRQWPTALAFTLGWCVALSAASLVLHCRRDRVFVDLL